MRHEILIIDDQKEYVDALKYALQAERHLRLNSVSCGDEGLKYLKEHLDIELVIVDLLLEEGCDKGKQENVDSVYLINQIYTIRPDIKIIVNTALPKLLSREQAERLYMPVTFLEKTTNIDTFIINVNKALGEDRYELDYIAINDNVLFSEMRRVMPDTFSLTEIINIEEADIIMSRIYEVYAKKVGESSELYNKVFRRAISSVSDLDSLMYLSGKRYRDHYKHQLRVGMLGLFMLETELNVKGKVKKLKNHCCENGSSKGLSVDELYLAWWLAAMLHDMAYPISYLLKSADLYRYVTKRYRDDAENYRDAYNKLMNIYYDYFVPELFSVLTFHGKDDTRDEMVRLVDRGLSMIFDSRSTEDNMFKSNLMEAESVLYDLYS